MAKRIIFEASCIAAPHLTGVGQSTLALIRAMMSTPRAKDVLLFVPLGMKKRVKELIPEARVRSVFLPDVLYRALRKFDIFPPIDLFLGKATYIFPNYWNARLAFSRSITYVYDLSFLLRPEFTERKNRKFLGGHIRSWIRRTDAVMTISASVKDEIVDTLRTDPDKVSVAYLGVDQNMYHPIPKELCSQVLQKYGIDRSYFLIVGSIEPRKNIITCIKAFERLPKDVRRSLALVIVGGGGWNNGEINAELQRAASVGVDVRRIEQYVPTRDLPALYSSAIALLQMAHYEGFGLTPLEALACNAPVIVSDIPVLREILGEKARYVNPCSVKDLTEMMRAFSAHEEGERARVKAPQADLPRVYSWERSAQTLIGVVEQLESTICGKI